MKLKALEPERIKKARDAMRKEMMRSFRELTEAKETVVFGFGRFNPPTTGHEKLIEKVASVAGSNPFFIYPSHTTGPKDPLPHAKKVAWMRKMFPKYKKKYHCR